MMLASPSDSSNGSVSWKAPTLPRRHPARTVEQIATARLIAAA
jgi:hypothetical protein